MTQKNNIPKLLLIGAGRFGKKHLTVLQRFVNDGQIELSGIIVKSAESQNVLKKENDVPVYTKVTNELLATIDAVDIVTPTETHYELVLKCLPHVGVLVEKPLTKMVHQAKRLKEIAQKSGHVLMVGHIYRFHSVTQKLHSIFENSKELPERVVGQFTNSIDSDTGCNPSFEMLHFYDILDYLLNGLTPDIISTERFGRIYKTSLRYKGLDAILTLGWTGDEKVRNLEFFTKDKIIKAHFDTGYIETYNNGNVDEYICRDDIDPLTKEIQTFITLIKNQSKDQIYTSADVASRIVSIAEKAQPRTHGLDRPRIAVIGAGIFGISCALECSSFADVSVFERNSDILSEASFVNQYRHHWGYHYPRSSSTVIDIKDAIDDFEALYNGAIVRNFPTYYGVAKEGSKISAEEYIAFCRDHNLPFELEFPKDKYMDKEKVEICLKTFEPIYNYGKLINLVKSHVTSKDSLMLHLVSRVTDVVIDAHGRKKVSIDQEGTMREDTFDYVINVTYANVNQFTKWLGFPKKEIRLDVVEALIIELPIPIISLAVMDGPFSNLVPTGDSHIFTLVHIKESILKRFVPSDGLIPPGLEMNSRAQSIIDKSREWFPILEKARLIESRYVYRSVNAYQEHDDARPSDIENHGFGCWSIMGGKILNSVTVAKKLAQNIKEISS